jgi:hypothetical protein
MRKDEMALEDFIVDITGKVAQNIEEIQHLFKVDKFNKIKNLVRELKFYNLNSFFFKDKILLVFNTIMTHLFCMVSSL